MNMRTGLQKTEPTSQAELLRQPIFSNPLITHTADLPLGVSGLSEGRAIAKAGCTKVKDIWDRENREWLSLSALGMNFHVITRTNKDTIINNIPWNPAAFSSRFQTGDWISNRDTGDHAPLTWIYYRVTGVSPNLVQAREYRRVSPNGLIRAENPQEVTLCPESYHLIRVLIQEKHGPLSRWPEIFLPFPNPQFSGFSKLDSLRTSPGTQGNGHWQGPSPLRGLPLFWIFGKAWLQEREKILHLAIKSSKFLRLLSASQNLAQLPPPQSGHSYLAHAEPRSSCRHLAAMYGDPFDVQGLQSQNS
jgi:hypothetical protein